MLADQYNTLQSSFAAAEKIFTILDVEPEIKDLDGAKDLDINTGSYGEWPSDVEFFEKALAEIGGDR